MVHAKWLLSVLGIVVITALPVQARVTHAGRAPRVQAQASLEIAAFQPFTGADASFGPEMLAGCDPAVLLINRAGGVLGHPLTCAAVDTRGDPADAIPAAQQLIATTSNLLGVLGPSSDEALATLPLFQRASIPAFPNSGQAALDQSTDPYLWRVTPADDVKGYAMAVWGRLKGYTRGATIFGNDIGSQGVLPTLNRGFARLGGQVVIDEKLALDQSSYRTEIERLLQAKPQVIFTELDPQSAATFLSELQQLGGLNIPVIGTELTLQGQWYQAVSRAIGASATARVVTGVEYYTPTAGPSWQTFNAALAPSGHKPGDWANDPYTMSYYDSVNLLALAAVAARSTSPATLNPYIAQVTGTLPGAVPVTSFAQGARALAQGRHIRYVGAAGPIAFNEYHNSVGAFEAARFGPHGQVILASVLPSATITTLSR